MGGDPDVEPTVGTTYAARSMVTADGGHPGNVIAYPDQALFLGLRGANQAAVMQAIWLYDHAVDLAAIERFRRNLYSGLLGRRVEPSGLPFGRHRWVRAPRQERNVETSDHARPPHELFDWANEQVDLPLDPERGPAWRIGVQPFTDGSTAVTLVVSHCIADGAGSALACLEAIGGAARDLGYPPPGSRTRWRGIREDLLQLIRDIPEIIRTMGYAARLAVRRRSDFSRPAGASGRSALPGGSGGQVRMPSASVIIDAADWDARAATLGGNSSSLASGFAATLASHLNRVRASDGAVTLMLPVSDRADLSDTGGNVVSIATVSVDPAGVTKDLTGLRNAIREALRTARDEPNEMTELLPLIPFLPKRSFARVVDIAFGFTSDLPVSCSNLGEWPAELLRLDGTPAKYLCFRGVDRGAERGTLDRRGGALTVASGRVENSVLMTIISYQPGQENTRTALREVVAKTLDDFGLAGLVI